MRHAILYLTGFQRAIVLMLEKESQLSACGESAPSTTAPEPVIAQKSCATAVHKSSLRRFQRKTRKMAKMSDRQLPPIEDYYSFFAVGVSAGSSSALRQLESGLYSCMALPSASVFLPMSFW